MTSSLYKVAVDSLSAHIAILDKEGRIIETNRAWREFGRANGLADAACIGVNYFAVCQQAGGGREETPMVVASAIRRVMAGEIDEFFIDYPCHSSAEERWFALRIVPFREQGGSKVILAHEDITPLVRVQNSLRQKEKELREKSRGLEESNIAMKVLLRHREEERQQLEENMVANVRQLVLPYVEELMNGALAGRERAMVDIIRQRLQEIISPFLFRLSTLGSFLTPREMQVAALVREGKSSKEIAEVLMISLSGVDFHRKQIRKKLGLSGSSTNLRSYLLSLQ